MYSFKDITAVRFAQQVRGIIDNCILNIYNHIIIPYYVVQHLSFIVNSRTWIYQSNVTVNCSP